jgi:chemotaxis protein CheC
MPPSPPVLVVDMTHAVVESLIAGMTIEVDNVVVFRINLASDEHAIAANILIFLEVSTLQTVAEMLERMIMPE